MTDRPTAFIIYDIIVLTLAFGPCVVLLAIVVRKLWAESRKNTRLIARSKPPNDCP